MIARPAAPGSLLGATYEGDQECSFVVWAPKAQKVQVHLLEPSERLVPMAKMERGYYQARIEGIEPGASYRYRLNDTIERPDPASRSQTEGVHGASQIVDPDFSWDVRSNHSPDRCFEGVRRYRFGIDACGAVPWKQELGL